MVSYFVSTFLTLAKICQSLTLMKKFHFSFLVQISHHVTVSLKQYPVILSDKSSRGSEGQMVKFEIKLWQHKIHNTYRCFSSAFTCLGLLVGIFTASMHWTRLRHGRSHIWKMVKLLVFYSVWSPPLPNSSYISDIKLWISIDFFYIFYEVWYAFYVMRIVTSKEEK